MTILIVSLAIAFSAIAWRDLKFSLTLLLGLLPVYLIRFSVGPVPITVLEIFILISFATWFIKYKAWSINIWSLGPITRPLLLLLAAASFGVVVAPDSISALGIWKAYFLEPAMVFLMLRTVFTTRNDWMNALKAIGLSSVFLSAFAIFQAATGIGIPSPWDLERRATSVFEYPNALGLYLSPVVSAALIMAFCRCKKKISVRDRILWSVVAMFGVIGIILAQTEAALAAIPAAFIFTLWISCTSKKIKTTATALAALGAILLIVVNPMVRQKITFQDYSGQVRLSQWSETVQLLKHHVPFGVGLNAYPTALEPYHDSTLYEIFQYPHNIFLNIWVELGLLGLFAFFWLAISVFKKTQLEGNELLKLAAFVALATMTIHGLVDVPYFKNDLAVMTWAFIALISASISTKARSHSERA